MEASKIIDTTLSANKVWCCGWGQMKPDAQDGGTVRKSKATEFVVTGSSKSQLNVVQISPSQFGSFPHEYSHQLPSMGIHQLAVSPDSSCIAAISVDGHLMLLDVKTGVRLPSVRHSLVSNYWSTCFGSSNECVYAGSGNGMIYKYDTEEGKLLHSYDTLRSEIILDLAVGKEHKLMGATDYAGNFTLLDGATGQVLRRRNYRQPLRRMVFDGNMRWALAACDDKTIKLIDLPSGRLRDTLTGHDACVMSVAASPDGQRFVSGACDGSIKIWDTRNMKVASGFLCCSNTKLWDVAFSRLNNKISFVGEGKGLSIYYCLGNSEMLLM